MLKLRWINETGGDWLHDGTEYVDMDLAEITAGMAFDDGVLDEGDIIQVVEDGEVIAEFCAEDFE